MFLLVNIILFFSFSDLISQKIRENKENIDIFILLDYTETT
jgi:hypothetical protein